MNSAMESGPGMNLISGGQKKVVGPPPEGGSSCGGFSDFIVARDL
jgi:hypothetical protein